VVRGIFGESDGTVAELTAPCDAYAKGVTAGMKLWPQPPATIIADYYDRNGMEQSITGAAMMPDGSYPGDKGRPHGTGEAINFRPVASCEPYPAGKSHAELAAGSGLAEVGTRLWR
jgi:hypothetical protein